MDKIDSLENRLFNAIPGNLAEMEQVKAAAKRELESNSLSFPQRTHALNIILLVNEMIAASKSESESDQGLKAYYQAARVSAGKASEVTNDKDALTKFGESVEVVRELSASITNDEARRFLGDIELYGTMSLTLTDDLTKSLTDILAEVHPDITMLHSTGDGNCLYNAISTEDYILQHNPSLEDIKKNKHEERQAELRRTTVDQMKASHAEADKIRDHKKNAVWGTDEQISYLVVAENKPILLLFPDPVDKTKICGTLYAKKEGTPANQDNLRVIVHINGNHFNALYTTPKTRHMLINQYGPNTVPVG